MEVKKMIQRSLGILVLLGIGVCPLAIGQQASGTAEAAPAGFARIDGVSPDWKTLTADDFEQANCDPETFTWEGSTVKCAGQPVGVLRSKKEYRNLEWVAWWRHLSHGGNSGFFVWTPSSALQGLKPGTLPKGGIEVQMLDHGYTDKYRQRTGKEPDWFTTHGDIFAVGTSKLTPFEPRSPNGSRSFPRANHSLGTPQWNHYYVRAIQGEVRLWVNGYEVSGGRGADPASGHLCLESEGAPVEWKEIRLRELP
jgi:hypothetical protein